MVVKGRTLNFGGDLDLLRRVNEHNTSIIAACHDLGEDNDPEALWLAFHLQGPTFISGSDDMGE